MFRSPPVPTLGVVGDATAPDGVRLVKLPSSQPLQAWAGFRDTLSEDGWTYLAVHTNASTADRAAAFAAGYVEGAITAQRIWEFADNKEGGTSGFSAALADYVHNQTAYIEEQVASNPDDPWWQQAGLLLRQEAGLLAGYNAQAPAHQRLDADAMLVMSLHSDMDTLCPLFGCTDVRGRPRVSRRGHCSVIVKLVPALRELYAAHTTWTSFEDMTRVYKLYDFAYSGVAARRIAMSSYPGNLFSTDDWYITGASLAVTETTIDNHNASLWAHVQPRTVPTWMRTQIANRLAGDGQSWARAFARENSGTYNNEFHVVDYKVFSDGEAKHGTLTVVDQMPGWIEVQDRSAWLTENGYWASYNRPGLPATYAIANYSAVVAAEGDHFSWSKTSRAQLFRMLHSNVTDESGLRSVMRHNRFDLPADPESITHQGCTNGPSASNAIAERGDLTPTTSGCIADIQRQDEGAIDLKYTTAALMKAGGLASVAQSGPTADDQPPFVWSTSPFADVKHAGQPDRWDFPYVTVDWGVEK